MAGLSRTIVIATGLYPPEIGGPATYTKQLEAELPPHGFGVAVLPFRDVKKYPKVLRHIMYFFKAFFAGLSADALYAQDPVSVGFPTMLAAKVLRKPFLLKVVGDYAWEQYVGQHMGARKFITPEEFQELEDVGFITELRRRIERRVARAADAVIVPSKYLKTIVAAWGVDEENIRIVANAVATPRVSESRNNLRRQYGLTGTVILSVGRLVPWKGFEALIHIFPRILKIVPDAKLVIIGDGPEHDYLRAQARKSGAEHRIVFAGRLERTDVLSYLTAADVFVLNSGYEGFSHQLLEAMALGVPVVTTESGGNPELITQGETGLLVPYNDEKLLREAIVALAKDRESAQKIAKQAQKYASTFSVRRMADKTADVLEEFV